MLRKATAAILLSTAFAATTAMAQTNTGTTAQRNTTGTAVTSPGATTNAAGTVRFITENRADLWRASQLEGVNIYNESNEHIGDISEVLLNPQGQIEAVVIGVGGFLGIGERDVAVPFNALQWQMTSANSVATRPGAATTGAAPQSNVAGAQPPQRSTTQTAPGATQSAPGTTTQGPTANNTATGATGTGVGTTNQMNDRPERAILAGATRDQLNNAPEFRYSR
ncbi:PRC-barrel domain-containing protein [Xanthobacteraceae bacterium Astr-EGSB]|uniref:PRC-barrel domain-containing protein n=1 Tax=Astrobacterium formosum TaxID=3069710 RepID=UPI0027ADC2B9|nr:PRC-barrel domain-containing protein [Xanthobacteraceae bacterium Astr-EGSB]